MHACMRKMAKKNCACFVSWFPSVLGKSGTVKSSALPQERKGGVCTCQETSVAVKCTYTVQGAGWHVSTAKGL